MQASANRLDLEAIERVVSGEGHYLGEDMTLDLMRTEYVYPTLGDRQSVADWTEAGRQSIWDRARVRVADLMHNDPEHLPTRIEQTIRERFDIQLDTEKT